MRMRTFVLVAALLSVGSALHAQEPVVGVKDPETLFKDPVPALNKNKQAALHIMRELLQCGQWDRAGEWLTQAYHQHNPNAASGLDGVITFFTKVLKVKRTDTCAKLTTEVVAVMADDDYVTVLTPRKFPDPRTPGKEYYTSWFDTWRFVNGKADEHWDPATIAPPARPHADSRSTASASRRREDIIVPDSVSELRQRLAGQHYVADQGLAVSLFLALRLHRPLFLEGEAGVGKTALATAIAGALGTDLIRLQCYEGLDVSHAVYEWDYARQLLELRILEASQAVDRTTVRRELYTDAFLIKRPLLQAIDPARSRPAVLLIDEIDRADEEFEGYLLELLAEFQITIPELGTIRASEPPLVILTSNRTREVHDALKRRCLYQWIDYPTLEKELAIVRARIPQASARLAEQVTALVQELRRMELYKVPGVSETLDWIAALIALDGDGLDTAALEHTLGVVLKAREDIDAVRGEPLGALLARVSTRR